MTRDEALSVLGLGVAPATHEIPLAFQRAMRAAHPDTSKDGSADKVKAVKEARDYLLSLNKDGEPPCKMCGGSGYVRGFKCSSCVREGRI